MANNPVPVQTLLLLEYLYVRALGLLQQFDCPLQSVLPLTNAVLQTVCADPRPLLPLQRASSSGRVFLNKHLEHSSDGFLFSLLPRVLNALAHLF